MSILTLDAYAAALKQTVLLNKSFQTFVGGRSIWGSMWPAGPLPGAGVYPSGVTTTGAVPTDATTGAPNIIFSSGSGYITKVEANISSGNWTTGRWMLYDRVWHAGAYTSTSNVTLSGQPSFSSRVPNGTDFTGLRLFVEVSVAGSGNQNLTVTYTDQSGNTGHSISAALGSSNSADIAWEMPLASGDCGLQKVESVVATVATSYTFHLVVVRPLWVGAFASGAYQNTATPITYVHGLEMIGMPQVFPDSCLAIMYSCDNSNVNINGDMMIEIASA